MANINLTNSDWSIKQEKLLSGKSVFSSADVLEFLTKIYPNVFWTGKVRCTGSKKNTEYVESLMTGGMSADFDINEVAVEDLTDELIKENSFNKDYELFFQTSRNDNVNSEFFAITNYGFYMLGTNDYFGYRNVVKDFHKEWQAFLLEKHPQEAGERIFKINEYFLNKMEEDLNKKVKQEEDLNAAITQLSKDMFDLESQNSAIEKIFESAQPGNE